MALIKPAPGLEMEDKHVKLPSLHMSGKREDQGKRGAEGEDGRRQRRLGGVFFEPSMMCCEGKCETQIEGSQPNRSCRTQLMPS